MVLERELAYCRHARGNSYRHERHVGIYVVARAVGDFGYFVGNFYYFGSSLVVYELRAVNNEARRIDFKRVVFPVDVKVHSRARGRAALAVVLIRNKRYKVFADRDIAVILRAALRVRSADIPVEHKRALAAFRGERARIVGVVFHIHGHDVGTDIQHVEYKLKAVARCRSKLPLAQKAVVIFRAAVCARRDKLGRLRNGVVGIDFSKTVTVGIQAVV